MATTTKSGFYGSDTDTYYVTPSGRVWHIQSDDDLGTDEPVERTELPDGLQACSSAMTLGEIAGWVARIEQVSGEVLTEA